MIKPKAPKTSNKPPVPIAKDSPKRGRNDDSDYDDDDEEEKESITADQMATILRGKDAIKYFPWPADENVTVAIRPLSREEVVRGAANGRRAAQSQGLIDVAVAMVEGAGGAKGVITWEDMLMRDEWLSMALRRADNPDLPLFRSAQDLRACLTTDEIDILYDILNEHMRQVMPLSLAERMARDEEWHRLISEIKKKPSEIFLAGLQPATLKEFVYFLVAQLPS